MNQGMPQIGKGQQIAGIGALAQPASMPKGRSPETMNEIMALARKMSDSQLAEVLSGRSMDIPQFAAMTEAMGRKKLRTAMQGAQAMGQAQQPTVKDRLAAETAQMAGLDQLPAPNMDTVDMASGGIVAFQNRGLVPSSYEEEEKLYPLVQEPGEDVRAFRRSLLDFTLPSLPSSLERKKKESKKPAAAEKEEIVELAPPVALQPPPPPPGGVKDVPPPPPAAPKTAGAAPSAEGIASLIPSFEQLQSRRSTDYLSKLEGLTQKQRESLGDIKKQGAGEALMLLGSGLLSAPTLGQGLAKGMPLVASTAAATRKEARAVENLANEYDMNLAKAREAAEKGDMALALQYQQLANQARAQQDTAAYQKGMLDVYGQRNAIMGDAANLGKVQLGLKNADAQALAEAKQKFPMVTKANQAAFDAFLKRRAYELKMENPLTKPYASLGGADFGSPQFNVVQSLPKGAKVIDPFES